MARAVYEFTQSNDGMLPLTGQLPDMKSDTKNFIQLQQIYRLKATKDAEEVTAIVRALLVSIGRDPNSIAHQDVATFCKNSAHLQVFQYRAVHDEYTCSTVSSAVWVDLQADNHEAAIYLVFRAVEQFRRLYQRYPGSDDALLDQDVQQLTKFLQATSQEPSELVQHITQEVCRYGGDHYHNIASIMGGIGSQEAIKLLTKQFVPLDNTVVFNGIRAASTQYRL
jgi:amyloid beta precursor protein binding protein 1